jgi:sugar lactone lactonase YvrE
LNQLYWPYRISIDDDLTIYIADCWNDRIIKWKHNATKGEIAAGGNGDGNRTNQLNVPTDVLIDKENNSLIIADRGNKRVMRWPRQNNSNGEIIISNIDCLHLTVDKDGSQYICDMQMNEVRRWKRGDVGEGTIVAGGNGQGDQLNQLDSPCCTFVDENYSVYVSDRDNNRVIKWEKDAKEGVVVAGRNGKGSSLTQLSGPRGIFVDTLGQIYVVDCNNERVVRWCPEGKEGTLIVGGNGQGDALNQFKSPRGISFDREENLYIVDERNSRIQKFELE